MNFFRPALILSLPLLLVVLMANRLISEAEDNVLPLRATSDRPLATIGLRHPLPHHPQGPATSLAACDKDIDVSSTIAGVTAIAAQNNGICTTGEADVYEEGGSLYVAQAGGEEAAFTITRIASDGSPTLVTQKAWQQPNTYTADIKAFKQGDSRYIALSLERFASNAACGVVIVDVTTAPTTQVVDQVIGADWCDVHNSVVENDANGDGKYLYLTADAPNDMRVLDIGNLNNITEIGRYTHPQAATTTMSTTSP